MDSKTVKLFVDLGLPEEIVREIEKHLIDIYHDEHRNKINMRYTSLLLYFISQQKCRFPTGIKKSLYIYESELKKDHNNRNKICLSGIIFPNKLRYIIRKQEKKYKKK